MGNSKKTANVPSVQQIAANLIDHKNVNNNGATVILGAGASVSSGIPIWSELAKTVCKESSIKINSGESAVDTLIEYFNYEDTSYSERYSKLQKYLVNKSPSIGYYHLAQLVKEGFISTILTTNWDSLLENALSRVIPSDLLKVMVVGEIPDDEIVKLLEFRKNFPSVIKLHGDMQSRKFHLGNSESSIFSPNLKKCLQDLASKCTIMVGQSAEDLDILRLIINREHDTGPMYHVCYDNKKSEIAKLIMGAKVQVIQGKRESVSAKKNLVEIGEFDNFFIQLNLSVQQKQSISRQEHLNKVEKSILKKDKDGIEYINNERINTMIKKFKMDVSEENPTMILFVDDPSAPSGMELKRRMIPLFESENIKFGDIKIQGKKNSRTHKRSVVSKLNNLNIEPKERILVLDAITFSGNTLKLAKIALEKKFKNIHVTLGALIISKQLYEQPHGKEYLYHTTSNRYEVVFPWGITQTTSGFTRTFKGYNNENQRQVNVMKRPWGAFQELAKDQISTVRLLTIEAGCKLSFQRHLCRDELFVALDHNIGLEVCAKNLEPETKEFDERVKCLVLEKNDYILIPRGMWHRTKASMNRVRLLEVAFGLYDQVNDIEKLWDDYGREQEDGSI